MDRTRQETNGESYSQVMDTRRAISPQRRVGRQLGRLIRRRHLVPAQTWVLRNPAAGCRSPSEEALGTVCASRVRTPRRSPHPAGCGGRRVAKLQGNDVDELIGIAGTTGYKLRYNNRYPWFAPAGTAWKRLVIPFAMAPTKSKEGLPAV